MIEFEKVLGAFSMLAELDEDEARDNSAIVELAIAEVTAMLSEGTNTFENHDRICHAAAALSYYKFALITASRESGFSVGDVSFSAPSVASVAQAKALRDDALGAISDIIDSRTFAFVGV